MATKSFSECIDFILEQEGGFSLNPSDPGNWTSGRVGSGQLKGTNMGIAACAFPELDIKNLTRSKAEEIYRSRYWSQVGGDVLPTGVDLVVFDFAVNSGPLMAAKSFRKTKSKKQGAVEIIQTISAERLSFLHTLQCWPRFGKGWGKRIAACEARALRMLSQSSLDSPLPGHVRNVRRKASREKALAGTAVIVSSTVAVAGPSFLSEAGIWIVIGAIPCLAAAGIFGLSAWRQSQRVSASLSEVKKLEVSNNVASTPGKPAT